MSSLLKNPTISNSATWSNPSGAETNGGGQASYLIVTTGVQDAWKNHRGFGYSIPTDATIKGIEVKSDLFDTPGCTKDNWRVRLSAPGVATTTDKSLSNGINGTETTKTFGGSTDLWGRTWTPSDINNSHFKIENGLLSASTCVSDTTFYDDYTRITIWWQSAPTSTPLTNQIHYEIWNNPTQDNTLALFLFLLVTIGTISIWLQRKGVKK